MAKKMMPATTKPNTPSAHDTWLANKAKNAAKAKAGEEAAKKKNDAYEAMKLNNRLGRGKKGY